MGPHRAKDATIPRRRERRSLLLEHFDRSSMRAARSALEVVSLLEVPPPAVDRPVACVGSTEWLGNASRPVCWDPGTGVGAVVLGGTWCRWDMGG